MKYVLRALLCLITTAGIAAADEASAKQAGSSRYISEAPLPKGWPEPGPYKQVTRKTYPDYRAAFTVSQKSNSSFRTLFSHIKSKGIPMTAPVEMKMREGENNAMQMEEMAFLYQNTKVGQTGNDGESVVVRDVPAQEALSYAWQGLRSKSSIARARKAIDEALAAQGLKASGYRLLGYNSPFILPWRQTHELQALLR
ncbi:MAG: heme-binding protein [Luteolibacter sp.]